jgi:hypothetical protein
MIRTLALFILWVGFIGYAFGLAPPYQPHTFDLIINLTTGNIANINPLIVALFNLMGVLPMMYSCLLWFDGRGQKLPAWLFIIGTFGLGALALLPYLALRQPYPTFGGQKNWWLQGLDAGWVGIVIAIVALSLCTYGVTQGNWGNFVAQWQSDRFIHVMTLDFCLLSLLFPSLLKDDMARRGLTDQRIFWAVALVPFFGAIAYLALRPVTVEGDHSTPRSGFEEGTA